MFRSGDFRIELKTQTPKETREHRCNTRDKDGNSRTQKAFIFQQDITAIGLRSDTW